MIKAKSLLVIPLAGALVLGACSNVPSKQDQGAIVGASAGALLGATVGSGSGQVLAAAAGLMIGALVGQSVGKSMDEQDRLAMAEAEGEAVRAPLGETIHWQNPNSGHSGTVTPTREGTTESGRYCREYQTTVLIGGKSEEAHGIACRQPDGSWQIVDRGEGS
jgi:surface antigen